MRVLVVDDDEGIRVALRRVLALDGCDVVVAESGTAALEVLQRERFSGVILDWGLPDIDGVEVCRRLRNAGDDVPILLLTARGSVDDRVDGLDAGADDFLVKPYELAELRARVRALLRRSRPDVSAGASRGNDRSRGERAYRLADLTMDLDAHRVTRGRRDIALSRTEFAVLELLLRNTGVVLARARILEEVWGYDFGGSSSNLDLYVSYIRRKLEADGEARLVHTVRGVGFVARVAS
jgi:two-component system, OmpR family, response regulator MprA